MLSSYDVSDATAAMITSLGAATGNLKLTVVSLLTVCLQFRQESFLMVFWWILNTGFLPTVGFISLLSCIDIITN